MIHDSASTPDPQGKKAYKGANIKRHLNEKRKKRCAMCTRDLSLLGRALRYERDTGEVSCEFFLGLFECVFKKIQFFLIPFWGGGGGVKTRTDTQSLGQTTAGTAAEHTMDGRSPTGPRPTTTGLGQNTRSRL